jgi:hypothetical protein
MLLNIPPSNSQPVGAKLLNIPPRNSQPVGAKLLNIPPRNSQPVGAKLLNIPPSNSQLVGAKLLNIPPIHRPTKWSVTEQNQYLPSECLTAQRKIKVPTITARMKTCICYLKNNA